MPNPRNPLVRGQRLEKIPVEAWNDNLQATADFRERTALGVEDAAGSDQGGTEIIVRNDTGGNLVAASVLHVGAPMLSPATALGEVMDRKNRIGTAPAGGESDFAITLEPIGDAAIGRARNMGLAWVKVDITVAAHRFASPKAGDTDKLLSGATGTARMLWQESGTGTKWALVRLGTADSGGTFLATTTSDVSARSGATFGEGTAILDGIPGGVLTSEGVNVEVYNKFLPGHAIPSGVNVTLNTDPYTGKLFIVEPDIKYRTQCAGGFLLGYSSADGGKSWAYDAVYTALLGCIPCPACASGSGSGCPDVSSYPSTVCLTSDIGLFNDECTDGTTQVALTKGGFFTQSWIKNYNQNPCQPTIFTFGCVPNNLWQVNVFDGDSNFVASYSYSGTWDGTVPMTLTGGGLSGFCPDCPATVTITPGACGSGSGSGGGGITRTSIGSAVAANATGSAIITGLPAIPVGSKLICVVGAASLHALTDVEVQLDCNLGTIGLVQDSASPSETVSGVLVQTFIFSYTVTSAINAGGQLRITANTGIFELSLKYGAAMYIGGLATNAFDKSAGADGSFSLPDTGFTPTTSVAAEYAGAVFAYVTPGGGTWQNGFASGGQDQSGTLSAVTFQFTEGYRILSSTVAVDAALGGVLPAGWAGVVSTYQ